MSVYESHHWNVNNRVNTVTEQVQALGRREPDVVALQDVNLHAVTRYTEAFRLIGLSHAMHTLSSQSHAVPTGVLIASRYPLSLPPDVPESVLWGQGFCSPDREKVRQHWARRTLFALLHSPWGEIEVANVYITPGNHMELKARGERRLYSSLKLDLLSGVYQALAVPATRLRLVCGDFNTPQRERANGEIITWGYQRRHGSYSCQKQHQLVHWLCSHFNLRLLTNELGGRLDYGQPGHRSRLLAKTFGGVMVLCSTYASAFTHGNALPWNPGNTIQLQRCY